LVEQAESELRSGLQAALRRAVAVKALSARPLPNRGSSICERPAAEAAVWKIWASKRRAESLRFRPTFTCY